MTADEPRADASRKTREFLRLLTAHDQEVFLYILTLVPHWSDAEDIAQEVRVRLWEQFVERYEPGSDFAAWARTIAWYLVLAHRKRSQKHHTQLGDELLAQLSAEFQTADDASLRQQALRACLEQLADERRGLLRKYYAGTSLSDLAAAAGTSAEAVRKVLFRARLSLAKCIDHKVRAEEQA